MIVLNLVIFTPDQTISGLSRYTLSLLPIQVFWIASLITREVWRWHFLLPKALMIVSVIVLGRFYDGTAIQFIDSPSTPMRAYTDIVSNCEQDLGTSTELLENADLYTNNCEFVHIASGLRCYHLSRTPESFEPEGEVYEDVVNGDIIPYMQEYGFDPPGINELLDDLEVFRSGFLIDFYRWPVQNLKIPQKLSSKSEAIGQQAGRFTIQDPDHIAINR